MTRRQALPSLLAALAVMAGAPATQAADYTWNWTGISNPNWDILLTDYGYSDYLFDSTPGYQGREYLSGEWGAALGYQRNGSTVSPTWLEPRFSFPDWDTNSNYTVLQPMTLGALTAQGLPTMRSVITNGAINITQDVRFVDTLTGIAMGARAASAGGAGASITSNRYVMAQSYTFENVSGATVDNLQFFQLLHGLNSQSGVYDNRVYAGPMANYRYDVTLGGDAGSAGGQFDYIAFHSKVAPSAVEVGHYGIDPVDDHSSGKPSVGTHLAVEANALNNADNFAPARLWVAGAQRYDLGTLAAGQSVQFDLVLSIQSGWQTTGGSGGSGGGTIGGTPGSTGSVDYEFQGSHEAGQFFVEFSAEDADGVHELVQLGEIGAPTFGTPGSRLQLFNVEYDGSFSGGLRLSFHYDASLLPAGYDLGLLRVFHWNGATWENLGGTLDLANNAITVFTSSLSPFAIGAVPEPATLAMWLAGLGLMGLASRRRG